jgi:hypothetical protein|tara:strand:+ start:620 stop:1036 length:417 start_codon:yes stop_codon:yes gene_type:complete
MTTEEQLARFVELAVEKRGLSARLKEVGREMEGLQEKLLEYFTQHGYSKMTISGTTVYVHRQLWAGPLAGDYPTACLAMIEAGDEWQEMVHERFSTQQLSARVRELDKEGEELPDELKEVINVSEVFSLRTRKGSNGG